VGLGRDLATELPIFLFDKSGTLFFMTLSNTWITGLLCVVLTLFLVQLPQSSYIVQGGAFVLLFGLCAYQFLTNRISIYKDGYTVFAGLFTALCLGSVFISDITYSSIILLPTYLIVPLVIMSFDRGHLNMDIIYKWIMGAGTILGVYALYQFYMQSGYSRITANAPFANPNSLAVFLGISCVIAWYRILTEKNKVHVLLCSSIILLCWAGIVTTSARGVMLGLCVVFIIVSFIQLKNDNRKRTLLHMLIFFMAAFLIFSVLKMTSPTEIFLQKFDMEVEPVGSRFNIWRGVINAIFSTNPIFGNGIGTFKDVYLHYRLPTDRASGLHGHNDLLHLVLELGFVVIIPFFALVFAIIKSFLGASVHERERILLPLSLLIFIAGCAMFTSIVLLPVFLLISGVIILDYKGRSCETGTVIGNERARYICAVFLMILITLQGQKFIVTRMMIDLRDASNQSNLNDFRVQINKMDVISLGHHPAVPIFQTSLLLNLWDANLISAEKKDVMAELNGYVDRAEELNAWNVETLYYRGEILKREGKLDDATALWRKALEIDPTYITVRFALADHMLDDDERYDLLKDGLHLKYWKQNPQKLFGMIMVEAKKNSDTKTYEKAEKRLTQLLR
jgi:O-antigen ligase